MRTSLGALLSVCSFSLAHAATLPFRFLNNTALSFDYSLQLANASQQGAPAHGVYLGKVSAARLSALPIIEPGGRSIVKDYEIAPGRGGDLVAFNLRTADGHRWGLRKLAPGAQHTCSLSPDWDGEDLTFVLQPHGPDGRGLKLLELLPTHQSCSFAMTPGYGPSLAPEVFAEAPRPIVDVRFRNNSSWSFDYTLQLANAVPGRHVPLLGQIVTLGAHSIATLSTHPIIHPQGQSAGKAYEIAPESGRDLVVFQMLTPDGRQWALHSDGAGGVRHACKLSQARDGMPVLFILQPHGPHADDLELEERPAQGRPCRFHLKPGLDQSAVFARQPEVSFQFRNHTSLSFDYSLQLKQGGPLHKGFVFLGEPSVDHLSSRPIMFPGGQSIVGYFAIPRMFTLDFVTFNMQTPDGKYWGLIPKQVLIMPQYCQLSQDWNGKRVTFVLQPRGTAAVKAELVEWLPDGTNCSFDVIPGSSWSFLLNPVD